MKPFMSLREFLLMVSPIDLEPKRSVHRNEMMPYPRHFRVPSSFAVDLVNRYDAAKASWEKYGEEGPPVGVKVQMLESGHGGSPGGVRILEGIYENDPRFFAVSRMEKLHFDNKQEKRISLVCRETWFIHMRVHE